LREDRRKHDALRNDTAKKSGSDGKCEGCSGAHDPDYRAKRAFQNSQSTNSILRLETGKFWDENQRQQNQDLRCPVLLAHFGVIISFAFSNRVR
jgi:hypothetical protein